MIVIVVRTVPAALFFMYRIYEPNTNHLLMCVIRIPNDVNLTKDSNVMQISVERNNSIGLYVAVKIAFTMMSGKKKPNTSKLAWNITILTLSLQYFYFTVFIPYGCFVSDHRRTSTLDISSQVATGGGGDNIKTLSQGGIHACARFSTKYEAIHIVPWLHYHKRLGISHFHLYFDSITSNLTIPVEKEAYDLIYQLPYVTVYDVFLVGFDTSQSSSLKHCITVAHIPQKADWVIDFDIDEVFSFNERKGNEPICADGEYDSPAGALATFVSTIPNDVLSVIIPRLEFRSGGVMVPHESKGQMELYVQREELLSTSGKVLIRADSTGRDKIKVQSKHFLWTKVLDSVSYPCGERVQNFTECDEDGYCSYHFDRAHLPQERHLTGVPFLYHYVTRSTQECLNKLQHLPSVNWRVKHSATVCEQQHKNTIMVQDYGVYCSGKTLRTELQQLYPNFNTGSAI